LKKDREKLARKEEKAAARDQEARTKNKKSDKSRYLI